MVKIFSLYCLLSVFICQTCSVIYNENSRIEFTPALGANDHSYFGYSVVMRTGSVPKLIVGAPRDTSRYVKHASIQDPGVIYTCDIGLNITKIACEQMILDTTGNQQFQQGNGRSYHSRKDNMWLGMAMDGTTSNNGTIVMCAPRWVNQLHKDYHLGNGLCYSISDTLPNNYKSSVLSLAPLVDQYNQGFVVPTSVLDNPKSTYYYAYGQFGISAKLSRDQTELIVGAPGVYAWTGTIVRYKITKVSRQGDYFSLKSIPNPYYTTEFDENGYFGYSVDSGKFVSGRPDLYVAGAPRGSDCKGQVLIFDFPLRENNRYIIFAEFEGTQVGEYFGATITALDINQDGLTDLIVGAPLYAQPFTYDLGRVDVFINHDKGKFVKQESLIMGKSINGARFGSTISSLGDINDDGFLDVAIGAPYEDGGRGAVYIYFGSANGLHPTYIQRITAAGSKGFGISISKGIDIDDNACNDIAIGAYDSASVYLLRCNPPIDVIVTLMSEPREIETETKEIEIEACFQFKKIKSHGLNLIVNISIDSQYKRASLRSLEDKKFNISNYDSDYKCKSLIVDIDLTIADFSRPIDVELKYDLSSDPSLAIPFCENCATLQPFDSKHKLLRIPFATGCGVNAVCKPDLVLSVESVPDYIIGSSSSISLNISVVNIGELAFLPVVQIPVHDRIPLLRIPPKCHVDDDILICGLESPLKLNSEGFIIIEFDTTLLNSDSKNIQFNVTASSGGEEINPSDNFKDLLVSLKTEYRINMIGQSIEDSDVYIDPNAINPPNVSISHAYEITNEGPTSLADIFIEIWVPYKLQLDQSSEEITILDGLNIKPKLDSQPLLCSSESELYNLPKLEGHTFDITNDTSETQSTVSYIQEESVIDSKIVDYKTYKGDSENMMWNISLPNNVTNEKDSKPISGIITYAIIKCTGPGLVAKKSRATVSIKMKLNTKNIAKLVENEKSLILSTYVKSSGVTKSIVDASVWTRSVIIGKAPPSSEASPWIIILAIVLGIILFTLITFMLYKMGFFRRKTHEELELLKNQESNKADSDDLTDTEQDS